MALRRILIANRGEIALRIVRAARSLGIETVLAASAADRDSMAAREADRDSRYRTRRPRAIPISIPAPDRSRGQSDRLRRAASRLRLSVGTRLARRSLRRGGHRLRRPDCGIHRAVGDKLSARRLAKAAGVPMTPGSEKLDTAARGGRVRRRQSAFPSSPRRRRAAAGEAWSSRRMRRPLAEAFERASIEAKEAFGDGTLYRRALRRARAPRRGAGPGATATGASLHFGERDCSLQRRYQKMVEEAPAAALPEATRARLHEAAVDLLASIRYRNAGTVEFLYDVDRDDFYFMEVNARIQVEHPVSEMITGVDLIQLQLEVAGGETLAYRAARHPSSTATRSRRASSPRIPTAVLRRRPGRIRIWRPPQERAFGSTRRWRRARCVPPFYDSMIAKLIVHAADRPRSGRAAARGAGCISRVEGVATNIALAPRVSPRIRTSSQSRSTRAGWKACSCPSIASQRKPDMAHIEFLDETMRDGQQSLWGMRMQAGMALPVAPLIDRSGFRVIDLAGSSLFEVMIRTCRENPWEGLDLLVAAMPRTRIRGGMRSNASVTFGVTPDSLMDAWMRQLNRARLPQLLDL